MELQITKVEKSLKIFIDRGNELLTKANNAVVISVEDIQMANTILKDCTVVEKEIEDERTKVTKPVNDFLKEINTLAKSIAIPAGEAKNAIKKKILTYNEEVERLRKVEAERLRLIEVEKQRIADEQRKTELLREQELRDIEDKRLADLRKVQSDEASKLEQERIDLERQKRDLEQEKKQLEADKEAEELKKQNEESMKKSYSNSGIKGVRNVTKWEISDETLIPRAFCSSDSKKINEAIKLGIKSIEGLRIFEVADVR